MERYPTTLDKLALVVTAATAAKDISVKEFGVGEDLPFNIYGWRGDELAIMAQLDSGLMNTDPMERFGRLTNAACIIRKGFLVDSFTLLAEGFCSFRPDETKDKKLAEAYLEPNSPVKECLTFTHVANGRVTFVTKPYVYKVPRHVEWDEELYYPGGTMFRSKDGAIPLMFDKVLSLDTAEEPTDAVEIDEYHKFLGDGLLEHGFFAQWFV
jgi:hypothetical protein